MSGSPYAISLGRLKSQLPTFLGKDQYAQLTQARDVAEVAKGLEATPYASEIASLSASYRGADLLELAINRYFVKRNRLAIEATPFAGKPTIGAFLRRWDVQNIGLILAAKAQGRSLGEAETFLVSSRDIPAGLFAGTMTLDDFRQLLQQPTLEAMAAALVKFGYGAVLLPLLDTYQRTKDIFPLLLALDREYYRVLRESTRYFQGDEWVVRLVIQSELDARNLLLLLKGKDSALGPEPVHDRFLEGGTISWNEAQDLYQAKGVPELVRQVESRFPSLPEGLPRFESDRSLVGFEVALLRDRAVRELKRLRAYPLSLGIIFTFLLLAEIERADLRKVVYGKVYGLRPAEISDSLVAPRL
ncbi:MAG TPA: V-type ATPase subunit [Thermoplasmata archaeon]|nr:V-type ATPase subunit [Thermoplasmata archaeon]